MVRVQDDLIYDVGLHLGEDSAFYLKLGYRVVAFEANPDLVAICQKRFSREIERGQLHIVSGAIADCKAPQHVKFYKNKKTVWGTTSEGWARRNNILGKESAEIFVTKVSFADCLRSFGVPLYLKIDVEGVDDLVLDLVCCGDVVPELISLESEKVDFQRLIDQIDRLENAGYRRFKIAQQATIPGRSIKSATREGQEIAYRFERHSSGPFGDQVPGSWMSKDQTIAKYEHIFGLYRTLGDASFVGKWGRFVTKPLEHIFRVGLPGWHDLHAAR